MSLNRSIPKKTAQLLSEARRKKRFTQQELADLTGISLRSIQRIEKGSVVPRAYTLNLLSKHLGIDFGVENETSRQFVTDKVLTTEPVMKQDYPATLKKILSIGIALLLVFIGAAFLSQSRYFPETTFELFLFWACITVIYLILMITVWKR